MTLAPTRPTGWLALLLCMMVGLLVVGLSWFELSSVDIGYHIMYGREHLRTGRIITVDPFIYGATDHFFINANWLSQVIMAWVFDHGGWQGLFALRVALVMVTFGCVALIARRAGASAPMIGITVLAAVIGSYERFSMRPELFSYAIMVAQLYLLLRGERTLAARIGVPLLQLAWVNLHSYFLVGPIMTAALAVGQTALSVVQRLTHGPSRAQPDSIVATVTGPMQIATGWLLVLVPQLLACVVNPWHLRGAVFPVQTLSYLRSTHAMGHEAGDPASGPWGIISEFQSPFSFVGYIGACRTTYAYLLLLGLAALGFGCALWRRRWGICLVIAFMLVMSMQMRRNIAQFALVAAPLSLGAISVAAAHIASKRSAAARRGRHIGMGMQTFALALTGWWLFGLVTGDFYFSERRPGRRIAAGWSDYIFPFDAVAWINQQSELRPRLFTDLMLSSNVLPWIRPEFQVFVDTNTFAYPPEQLMRAWNVAIGKEPHSGLFDGYGVNVAMLRAQDATQPLIRKLANDPAWALVWFDHYTTIFVRRIAEHAALIHLHEKSRSFLDVKRWCADAPRSGDNSAFRLCGMTNVPFSLGWFDVAKPLYEECLRLEPAYFEAWNNLGVCHNELGKALTAAKRYPQALDEFKKARACFENSLRIRPTNLEAKYNLDNTPVEFQF